MKHLIVDTTPRGMRGATSINVGYEIVSEMSGAEKVKWFQIIDGEYDKVLFNVIYPPNIINAGRFIRDNKLREKNIPMEFGGQGIGINGIASGLGKEFYGEYDLATNKNEITSRAFLGPNRGIIELTRGCRYKCKFCEYSNVFSSYCENRYREKPLDLVKEQIKEMKSAGKKLINFMSANFAGYSELDKLMGFCIDSGMTVASNDSCFRDIPKILQYRNYMPSSIKIGIESFDEATRYRIGKGVSDESFWELIPKIIKHFNYLHFYLIYGLPEDNYNKWKETIERLGEIRKSYGVSTQRDVFGNDVVKYDTALRFEFNITNFEPCLGTPLEEAPLVDFVEKERFLNDLWVPCLINNGFIKPRGKPIDYTNAKGRLGRMEMSYRMLMYLKQTKDIPLVTDRILYALPFGVGSSISDKQAKQFLAYNHR